MKSAQHSKCVLSQQFAINAKVLIALTLAIVMTAGICSAEDTIFVRCALPYVTGGAPQACVGLHQVVINTTNTDSNAKITAELLGLDTNGLLINSLLVKNGDQVQLGSRMQPGAWKFQQNGNVSEVFAPVPLLHVTVEDRGLRADAYCSNIPYLQVVQPTGGVVSESSGNDTYVLAAAPLTDPAQLHLFVDGVDMLSQVNNYLACTPGAPCNGTANINGSNVKYSNLIVDVAPDISTPASNTIRVTLTDLKCGGHNFNVSSVPTPGYPDKKNLSNQCNVDSLSKNATSSVFAISITDPFPGKITQIIPTPVAGEACSGTQITSLNISGKELSVAGQVFAPGNGTTTGDVYKVPINTTLDKTDLVRDAFLTHDAPLGTFDIGSNRLAASAKEIRGNRTFKNVIFATGAISPVAVDPNAQVFQSAAIQSAVNSELQKMVESNIADTFNAPANTDLANAFVVGLTASGTQTMFNKLCTSPIQSSDPSINGLTPGQAFRKKVRQAILAVPSTQVSVPSVCSCDPPVNMFVTAVDVGTDVSCNVTFNQGSFHVQMGLPNIHVVAKADGWCKTTLLDACVEGLAIALEGTADVTGIKFDFNVTESNILNDTVDQQPVFFKGNTATALHDITNHFGDQGISFCGLSEVCSIVVTIFTFGAIDLTPTINISQIQDFSGQIGASEPDPVKIKKIQVDPNVVKTFDQKLSGNVSEVHINPNGITAGLVGHFASLAVDPSVPPVPGITLTPAPVPPLPIPNIKDIFVGVSDDAINMMFASLTGAGKFKTGPSTGNGCIDTGMTLGALLPAAGCDSLQGASDLETITVRAYCHAAKGTNCGTLTFNNPALTAAENLFLQSTERGSCYGTQGLPAGQTCNSVAQGNLAIGTACANHPDANLHANQPLLFCSKGDVPPRMLFPDTNVSGGAVPSVLRVPSLSVSLVVDRNQDHQVLGNFGDVKGCFALNSSNAVDCSAYTACLAINLNFTMASQTCSDNKPGFVPTFQSVQVLQRQAGTVCAGGTSATGDPNILEQASAQQITIPLGENGAGFAPPICGAGLDLGGFVQCTNAGVLSMKSANPPYPESRDYLAITCKVQ